VSSARHLLSPSTSAKPIMSNVDNEGARFSAVVGSSQPGRGPAPVYHELDIALPTAGRKTGRTIRKPALLTVRPASEREQDSRKRDNERDQLKSLNEQSGGYDRLDDHRLLTWINHCSFFYANLEYLASLGSRT
jgi:hypothetical protein